MLSGLAILIFTPDKFFSNNYRRSETILNLKDIKDIKDANDDMEDDFNNIYKTQNMITPEDLLKNEDKKQAGKVDEEKFKKYIYILFT